MIRGVAARALLAVAATAEAVTPSAELESARAAFAAGRYAEAVEDVRELLGETWMVSDSGPWAGFRGI